MVRPYNGVLRNKRELLIRGATWMNLKCIILDSKGYILSMIPFTRYVHHLHKKFVFNMKYLKNNNKANTLYPTLLRNNSVLTMEAEYLCSFPPFPLSWIYHSLGFLYCITPYTCTLNSILFIVLTFWILSKCTETVLLGLDCFSQHCFWDSSMLILVAAVQSLLLL